MNYTLKKVSIFTVIAALAMPHTAKSSVIHDSIVFLSGSIITIFFFLFSNKYKLSSSHVTVENNKPESSPDNSRWSQQAELWGGRMVLKKETAGNQKYFVHVDSEGPDGKTCLCYRVVDEDYLYLATPNENGTQYTFRLARTQPQFFLSKHTSMNRAEL